MISIMTLARKAIRRLNIRSCDSDIIPELSKSSETICCFTQVNPDLGIVSIHHLVDLIQSELLQFPDRLSDFF